MRDLRQVAARRNTLVVIEDMDASGCGVHGHPRKPLGAIVTGPAVEQHRRRECQAVVGAALERDVGAVAGIIVGVDDVHVTVGAGRRVVDGKGRKHVDAIVAEDVIDEEERGRRQLDGRTPRRAVIGRARERHLIGQVVERPPPRDVGLPRMVPGEPGDRRLTVSRRVADDLTRRPRRGRRRDVVRIGDRNLRRGRREVRPAHRHAAAIGIDVHQLLVGVVLRRAADVDVAAGVGGRRHDERTAPRVAAIGRPVDAHRLYCPRRRELGDDDRGVDERAAAHVLDVRVAEDLRQPGRADGVDARRRQLAAVYEMLAAVVRVHEARHRDRVGVEPAKVVEPDDDVLAGTIDGNRCLGLRRRWAILQWFVFVTLALRLVDADAGILELLIGDTAVRGQFELRARARRRAAHRRQRSVVTP